MGTERVAEDVRPVEAPPGPNSELVKAGWRHSGPPESAVACRSVKSDTRGPYSRLSSFAATDATDGPSRKPSRTAQRFRPYPAGVLDAATTVGAVTPSSVFETEHDCGQYHCADENRGPRVVLRAVCNAGVSGSKPRRRARGEAKPSGRAPVFSRRD